MKRREYFFCAKKTKPLYSTIHLLWFSVAPFWRISAGRKQRTLFCSTRVLALYSLYILKHEPEKQKTDFSDHYFMSGFRVNIVQMQIFHEHFTKIQIFQKRNFRHFHDSSRPDVTFLQFFVASEHLMLCFAAGCCTVIGWRCRTRWRTSWMESCWISTCTSAPWSEANWPRRSAQPQTLWVLDSMILTVALGQRKFNYAGNILNNNLTYFPCV